MLYALCTGLQEVSWCSSFVYSLIPLKMKSTLTSPGYPTASGGTGQPLPSLLEGSATLGKSLTISLSRIIICTDCGSSLLWTLWGSEVTKSAGMKHMHMGTSSVLLSAGPCSVTHRHLLFILRGWGYPEDPWLCLLKNSHLVMVCVREGALCGVLRMVVAPLLLELSELQFLTTIKTPRLNFTASCIYY